MGRISISEAIDMTSGSLKYQSQILFISILTQFGLSCYMSGLSYMLPDTLKGPTATTSFQLVNRDDSVRSLITNAFYIGIPIGSLVFAWIADKYGRKLVLQQGTFWSAVFLIFGAISLTERMLLLASLFLGIFLVSGLIGGILMLVEVTPKKSRAKMTSILLAAWSSGLLFNSVMYTAMVSWRITLASAGLILILAQIFLQRVFESPRYLLANSRVREAEEVLTKISSINGCPEFSRDLEIVNKGNVTKHSYVLLLNKQTLITTIMFLNAISIYYFTLSSRLVFETAYFNGMIIAALEIFTIILSNVSCNYFSRKNVFISGVFLSRFCLLVLSMLEANGDSGSITTIMFHILSKIGSSTELLIVCLYIIEIFPTYIRGMTFGWCICNAKLGGGSSSVVLSLINLTGLNPLLGLAVFTSTSFIVAYFMEETCDKELREMEFEDHESEKKPMSISLTKLNI